MNLEQYFTVSHSDYTQYTFYSEGPNGRIEKVISFNRIPNMSENFYNLSFGDWDHRLLKINHLAISNNSDLEKILATVASTVFKFLVRHPYAFVYAEGATLSRTRLYPMKIAAHWLTICKLMHAYGWINNQWKPFQKGVNYEAFLAELK